MVTKNFHKSTTGGTDYWYFYLAVSSTSNKSRSILWSETFVKRKPTRNKFWWNISKNISKVNFNPASNPVGLKMNQISKRQTFSKHTWLVLGYKFVKICKRFILLSFLDQRRICKRNIFKDENHFCRKKKVARTSTNSIAVTSAF